MKKKLYVAIVFLIGMLLLSSTSMATSINPLGGGDGGELNLQTILNNITTGPNPGVSSINVNTDQVLYDSYWSITAAGGSISTIIIEIAGWKNLNTFGVYSGSNSVQIFAGPAGAGTQASLSIAADGSVFVNFVDTGVNFAGNLFGYYIGTPNGTFYSDTSLNSDQFDHMVAFQGKNIDTVQLPGWAPGLWTSNEYVLAFEDTLRGGDYDYNDLVLMVESVHPIPEPATMLLLGSGLIGLAGYARRRFKK